MKITPQIRVRTDAAAAAQARLIAAVLGHADRRRSRIEALFDESAPISTITGKDPK